MVGTDKLTSHYSKHGAPPIRRLPLAHQIDYLFAPQSPWTYLGHARFVKMAEADSAQVRVMGGSGGFRISATGQAMTTGLVGQNARVRLPGGKVVNGL
ncbi:MAG: hypothetical protein EOO25_18095, partial [Comamonadaceae bacterium]